MSTIDAGADRRLELALEAARSERRNRPVGVVVIAGLLFGVALIYVLLAFSALAGAKSRLDATQVKASEAVRVASRLAALKAAEASGSGPRAFEKNANLLTDISTQAREAGFKPENIDKVIPKSTYVNRPSGTKGVLQRQYSYEVRAEPLPVLLDWLNRCTAKINGLEVYSVSLTPEAQSWFLKVTFSRWERDE